MEDRTASEIMTRPAISAKLKASARDIALQFINEQYSGMPVTEEDGKVIGIVTEIDILKALNDGHELSHLNAGDIMTPDVATVNPDTPITEMIKMMEEFSIIRLPVVKDEKLVGVVSRGDIIRNLIEPEFMSNI
ncbi:MAG: CBS domain-containing protein [Nitrospina sp.]|jgi:predicted transcriptional regulator|nr:CBS domain-containing protein [Nitrospina sp.]MBT3509750.1 CBS domain-containing protein [Nitrospina sp.]MBT3874849.1 CBS domain-containing protein [Nitrospina sp.]MBT4049748.1 CBS domain-containing protein [Nitrospina sp.]MBT4558770.1 CBS domain-containing protein [Nitrospina sp.]